MGKNGKNGTAKSLADPTILSRLTRRTKHFSQLSLKRPKAVATNTLSTKRTEFSG
jgi:hypothetical protein